MGRIGLQSRIMARRCALLYAAMLGVGVALAAVGVAVRYSALHGWAVRVSYLADPMWGAGAADVESTMGWMLFLAGVIWFTAFVGPELCHGVSRRSAALAPAVCAAAGAALSSAVMTAAEYALAYRGRSAAAQGAGEAVADAYGWWSNDLIRMPFSFRFLYAWQLMPGSTGGTIKVSGIIDGGWMFMGLACFALMLMAATLGMLAGAVIAWACAGGLRRIVPGVCVVVAAYVAGMRLFLTNGSATVYWTALAMSGEVVRYGSAWSERHLYVAWIPFTESLVLFAVCVLVVLRLTLRREVIASHRWLV